MAYNTYPLERPFLKSFGFNPSPVVTNGIPYWADSYANPKCVYTPAWREYWEEQLYYCINGYETAGVFIPGRYYYYLNFCYTSSVSGTGAFRPTYVDSQYEFFLLVEEAKRLGKNIILPKGRRKGITISEISIIDHGFRFLPSYHAGIGAGASTYSDEFLAKWEYCDSRMVNEFKVRHTGTDIITAGWEEKAETGGWITGGSSNMIYIQTMFADPEAFKGKYFQDVIFEESGEFDNLIKAYQATKKCVMDGNEQKGTIFFCGTGGNIKTGSSGFETIWHNYEDFNGLRYFFDGRKFYKPCVGGNKNEKGEINEDVPNLKHIEPHQRIGIEDLDRAEELINIEKAKLLKNPDKTNYWEECKDNPTDIKEVFRRSSSNTFPVEILNKQMYDIKEAEGAGDRKWGKFKLEFVLNAKGERVEPWQVVAKPLPNDTDEKECVCILFDGMPMPAMENMFVGGCLTEGEKVMTDTGLMNVELVTKENKLINDKGDCVEIHELLRRSVINKNTYNIRVSNTFRTTTFTEEHPILVAKTVWNKDKGIDRNKFDFNYKEVSRIEVNDWIKVPNIYCKKNDINISFLWKNTYKKGHKVRNPVYEKDFWWLVGLWLGDGWCDTTKRSTSFAINILEPEYLKRLVKITRTLFDRDATIRERNGCFEITICNESLCKFLCDNFGKYAIGKKIPEWAKKIEKEHKKQLVLGYLDSDGSISHDKKRNLYNTQFISINLELVESIQDILFSLGYVSQICKLRSAGKYMFPNRTVASNIKECYQLRLGHGDTLRLAKDLWNDFDPKLKRIDFNSLKKIKRKRAADGCFIDESLEYIYFQIREINKGTYTGVVYNFNCDTHTFMCHHITTHNCDSYDTNQALTSKSLGAMVVLRRNHDIKGIEKMQPVCIIRTRPERRETFYEMCLMVSIFYDLRGRTLIDYAKNVILNYYTTNGCEKYLGKRPKKYESPNSEQTHVYGMLVPVPAIMHGMLETYFYNHGHKIWFDLIIDEALSFDDKTRYAESDKDLVDALGFALAMDGSYEYGVREEEEEDSDTYNMPEFRMNANGEMVLSQGGFDTDNHTEDGVSFGG